MVSLSRLCGSYRQLAWLALVCTAATSIAVGIVYPLYLNSCFVNGLDLLGELEPARAVLYNRIYLFLCAVGSLAFPFSAFLLVQGVVHLHNLKQIGLRLLLFAALSEIPYDLTFAHTLFDTSLQSPLWTLLLLFVLLYVLGKLEHTAPMSRIFGSLGFVLATMAAALVFHMEYGGFGVLFAAILFLFRAHPKAQIPLCALSLIAMQIESASILPLHFFSIAALLFLFPHCSEGVFPKHQMFFLCFYPLHLLLVSLLSLFVL